MTEELNQLINPTEALSQSDKVETEFAQKAVEHLSNWDSDRCSVINISPQQFHAQEAYLMELEKLRIMLMQPISHNEPIGPQEAVYGDYQETLKTWGDLTSYIGWALSQNEQFNILVTGLSISGKATMRRAITKELQKDHPGKVTSIDRDYIKMPYQFVLDKGINIVEDMHGLDPGSLNCDDLDSYNMLIYLKPNEPQHIRMINERGKIWMQAEGRKADLTDGNGTASDDQLAKFFQSVKSQTRVRLARDRILHEDAPVLDQLRRRIPVVTVDPAVVINLSYRK